MVSARPGADYVAPGKNSETGRRKRRRRRRGGRIFVVHRKDTTTLLNYSDLPGSKKIEIEKKINKCFFRNCDLETDVF
jgi:hypothetical protein